MPPPMTMIQIQYVSGRRRTKCRIASACKMTPYG